MAKYGKWIGGGLGWALGGPIGGILGFVVGSMFDNKEGGPRQRVFTGTTHGDYTMSLLVLVASVMKADGKVVKSELEYVRQYFRQSFGKSATDEAMLYLRDILKQDIPLRDVCIQIKQRMEHPLRLQLIHFLFGISRADGKVHPLEVKVIQDIAGYLGISSKDFDSIKSMFFEDTAAAYRILGIDESATNDDLKKAYRKMANKYHPDKVAYLGEDIRKAAAEKFRKVKDAYEAILKERG